MRRFHLIAIAGLWACAGDGGSSGGIDARFAQPDASVPVADASVSNADAPVPIPDAPVDAPVSIPDTRLDAPSTDARPGAPDSGEDAGRPDGATLLDAQAPGDAASAAPDAAVCPNPCGTGCCSGTNGWVTPAGSACKNGRDPAPASSACEWRTCKDDPLPATVFYVCDSGGDDARTAAQAQDPSTPWATWAKALNHFPSLTAGQAIAFCRGGTFIGSSVNTTVWTNDHGTSGAPVIVRDYTRPGREGLGDPRPIITGLWGELAAGWSKWENLAVHGGTSFDGSRGFTMSTWADHSHISVCNVEFYQGPLAFFSQGEGNTSTDISLVGNRYVGQAMHGYLGQGVNVTIADSWFYDWGRAPYTFAHAIYFGGVNTHLSRSEAARGNVFVLRDGQTGSTVVVHGKHSDMVLEGNTFKLESGSAPAAWGFGILPGYGGDEYNTGLIVRGNLFTYPGYIAIAASNCQGCLVENNIIAGEGTGPAISFPYQPVDPAYPARATTQSTVRNNTIYRAARPALYMHPEGGPHIVQNNVWQTGGPCLDVTGVDTSLFDYNGYSLCTGAPLGSHSWAADPRWENPPADLRPGTSSPLTGGGNPAQRPATDFNGVARPTAPAIGALER